MALDWIGLDWIVLDLIDLLIVWLFTDIVVNKLLFFDVDAGVHFDEVFEDEAGIGKVNNVGQNSAKQCGNWHFAYILWHISEVVLINWLLCLVFVSFGGLNYVWMLFCFIVRLGWILLEYALCFWVFYFRYLWF